MPASTRIADGWRVKRPHVRMALAVLVVSAPTLLASLPGDWFDEDVEGLNRNVEPLDLPDPVHAAICVLAAVALAVSVLMLLSPAGRQASRRADVRVAAPLLFAGLYAAFTYRVFTAAVTGANIGGGMLFLVGVPLVPGLVVIGAVNAWSARHASSTADR